MFFRIELKAVCHYSILFYSANQQSVNWHLVQRFAEKYIPKLNAVTKIVCKHVGMASRIDSVETVNVHSPFTQYSVVGTYRRK